jgi:pimeloyl-ACP methyl ester carboxylesterase
MHPGAIDRLVLVAAVGLKPDEGEILDIFYHTPEEMLRFSMLEPESAPEFAELDGRPPTPEEAETATRNREMAARLTWKPYMFNPRLARFLPRAKMPALVVWGREDAIVPVICGEQYARLLPRATLAVLERCGHAPPIERPAEFATMVLDFLGGRP